MIKQNIKYLFFSLLTAGLLHAQDAVNQYDSNGERHGRWTKNFDGTKQIRYEGQFEHGKEIGEFKYYQMVGKRSLLAATKSFDTDGSAYTIFLSLKGMPISEGRMVGKNYVGEWKYYHKNSDQLMTLENYNQDGQLDGIRTVFYQNGSKAEELNYTSGQLNGSAVYYSEDGTVIKRYQYENDQLHCYLQARGIRQKWSQNRHANSS